MGLTPVLGGRFRDYPRKIMREGAVLRIPQPEFVSYGQEGGKWAGTSFFYRLLSDAEGEIAGRFGGRVQFAAPKTTVVRTGFFERFMEANQLWGKISSCSDDAQVRLEFARADFSGGQKEELSRLLEYHVRPVVVRSSALNEDRERASFAGVYSSVFLPNSHLDGEVRLAQLEHAVKIVYASAFCSQAQGYLEAFGMKGSPGMAVIVQNVVGRQWKSAEGRLIYHPEISFTGFSFNDYATGDAEAGDGFLRMSFGLGVGAVQNDGRTALRVDLGRPEVLPGLYGPRERAALSPQEFYAVDMSENSGVPDSEESFLVRMHMVDHGERELLERNCEWYDPDDDMVSHWHRYGSRASPVFTFPRLLEKNDSVFIPVIRFLNGLLKEKFGMDVDFEGAADVEYGEGKDRLVVYPLQARPQVRQKNPRLERLPEVPEEKLLMACEGIGGCKEARFVLAIKPEEFDWQERSRMSEEIFNADKKLEKGSYLLVVPGRFGTREPTLGIPGGFGTVSNSAGIVEVKSIGRDMSQGSHFFEAVVGAGISYLSCEPDGVNWAALEKSAKSVSRAGEYLLVYEFENPVSLLMDKEGKAVLKAP